MASGSQEADVVFVGAAASIAVLAAALLWWHARTVGAAPKERPERRAADVHPAAAARGIAVVALATLALVLVAVALASLTALLAGRG